jgi:hypothetical protein
LVVVVEWHIDFSLEHSCMSRAFSVNVCMALSIAMSVQSKARKVYCCPKIQKKKKQNKESKMLALFQHKHFHGICRHVY